MKHGSVSLIAGTIVLALVTGCGAKSSGIADEQQNAFVAALDHWNCEDIDVWQLAKKYGVELQATDLVLPTQAYSVASASSGGEGPLDHPWTDLENVQWPNFGSAYLGPQFRPGLFSEYLVINGYDMQIPDNAIITGVEWHLYHWDSGLGGEHPIDVGTYVFWDQDLHGVNRAKYEYLPIDEVVTYGCGIDRWGDLPLTPAVVNSPKFGFGYRVKAMPEGVIHTSVDIATAWLKVYYFLLGDN